MWSRFRLSPSLAVALLALCVALGGTSYAVGVQINGAELKSRSVGGDKLELHTVRGDEVDVASLPQVPAARRADDATNAAHATVATEAGMLTGTLPGIQVTGTVENATNAAYATDASNASDATSASNATNATNAVNADNALSAATVTNQTNVTANGHIFDQIDASAGSGSPADLLTNFDGLTLQCIGPAGTSGTVTLAVVNSSTPGGSFGAGEIEEDTEHFEQGTVPPATNGAPVTTDFTFPIGSTDGGGAQVNFSYSGSATVVSGTFTMIQDDGCSAFGNADGAAAIPQAVARR